uniref:hypothetical protein n=1 Tax=Algoriphagus sp. TaxID=1872435 RepID=UPI004047BC4B
MRKTSVFIFSAIIYIIVWWILTAIAVGINLFLLGRETGSITALGGIMAVWLSYKIVKWLRKKYLYKLS